MTFEAVLEGGKSARRLIERGSTDAQCIRTRRDTCRRQKQGRLSYLKGVAAEEQVANAYLRNGFEVVERRWKTKEGEVDLIARHKDKLYFVEVKSSKTFESALEQITPKQQQRIHDAALRYLAEKAKKLEVDCRFDAALVDGQGRIKVLPGILLDN